MLINALKEEICCFNLEKNRFRKEHYHTEPHLNRREDTGYERSVFSEEY